MRVQAEGVHVEIDGHQILAPTSFVAESGATVALVGASGSGKTTLLNCLSMLLPPSGGVITLGDRTTAQIGRGGRRAFWRAHCAFIFQEFGLVEDESVGFNVRLHAAPVFRTRRRDWGPEVGAALAAVGLAERVDEQVSRLSGGERQRVGIARAIAKRAELIFADEPTASLDEGNRERVASLLLGAAARGATVLVATHDESLAEACDQVVLLSETPMAGRRARRAEPYSVAAADEPA